MLNAFANPVTAGSAISFQTPATAYATVKVYNLMGRPMATLFDGVAEGGRDYALPLNSARWPAGIYLCQFVSQGQTRTQRLMVTR